MGMPRAFPIERKRRGKPTPPNTDTRQRVSSWTFDDGALKHAARDGDVAECYGNVTLKPSRVGDLARCVMGAVMR